MILLLDEIYIREDLIFDKYSGRLIGFSSLGSVSDHLLAYERKLEGDKEELPLAKTMMVFMVKGLFTPLKFPYAQFPALPLLVTFFFIPSGRQSSCRLEKMEFKV